ncbi:hypothetical protein [Marinoscillum sp.]|uniref:hypothetical protein n=1 Tax=Marinoscillum sp. TaxID=2024838 RepID=UPI003BAB7853
MRYYLGFLIVLTVGCGGPDSQDSLTIQGTWRLLSGTTIQGTDTTVTDYTRDQKVLKIINQTHFAFIRHDLSKGKDSTNSIFVAGAGAYSLQGNKYTENLEFCSYRPWEGNNFSFEMEFNHDTLVQTGIEKIEELGVDQIIIERYVRNK